jgi:hypothetical protein
MSSLSLLSVADTLSTTTAMLVADSEESELVDSQATTQVLPCSSQSTASSTPPRTPPSARRSSSPRVAPNAPKKELSLSLMNNSNGSANSNAGASNNKKTGVQRRLFHKDYDYELQQHQQLMIAKQQQAQAKTCRVFTATESLWNSMWRHMMLYGGMDLPAKLLQAKHLLRDCGMFPYNELAVCYNTAAAEDGAADNTENSAVNNTNRCIVSVDSLEDLRKEQVPPFTFALDSVNNVLAGSITLRVRLQYKPAPIGIEPNYDDLMHLINSNGVNSSSTDSNNNRTSNSNNNTRNSSCSLSDDKGDDKCALWFGIITVPNAASREQLSYSEAVDKHCVWYCTSTRVPWNWFGPIDAECPAWWANHHQPGTAMDCIASMGADQWESMQKVLVELADCISWNLFVRAHSLALLHNGTGQQQQQS